MTAARRLAAILAVDVAGYSRLMGEDEAGTAKAVREHREAARPVVQGLGGRIVKTMGDGVLLEFPSVVAAVECAIALQKLMVGRNADVPEGKRIVYRIGVHLGDVLIDGDDILGDGVNIAARLEAIAAPGGICLSGMAYESVRGKVEADFTDLGERELKNIARPVRVYASAPQDTSVVPAKAGTQGDRASLTLDSRLRGNDESGAMAQKENSPPRLSIVVLPFANIGGDPEQEYFVDGVTESLTTDLSRISGSFVIARNTAFTFKSKPVDVKQIGRELNVRYLLEGSVQRGGNRMRVNVQLIEAETGIHLWAERFDKPVADLFDMQDEIVAYLANQLNTQLVVAEARRAERAPLPDSMDLYFQGTACFHKGYNPENLAQARRYFERALALDPNNIEALAGEALVDVVIGGGVMSEDRVLRIAAAEAAANKVLSVAPNHAPAHYILGFVHIVTNRAAQGMAECEHALALDHNLAAAHAMIGLAKSVLGRAEETEGHVREALRLSPREITANSWMHLAGGAKLVLGRDQEAVAWLRRSIEANRTYPLAHFYLAAALVHLDRLEEARASVQTGLVLDPTFTIRRYRAGASSDNPTYLAQREHIYDGMRKAGVPEGEPEKPAPPRLSIVVLPFANLGGDPEQEYFVDGVTESLTTDLSRISGSFVIARNTAFTYKGKPVDVKQIGRDLNIRYVLEGSVQRGGNRMRVNVQLIDAETGNHLWAERFDKPVADLFDMQDEIVARLANQLNAELIEAEARRAEKKPNPDSMDFYFQGRAWLNKGIAPANLTPAGNFLERALALDPDNVEALVATAYLRALRAAARLADDVTTSLSVAEENLNRALIIAPDYAQAHHALGTVYNSTKRAALGLSECEHALTLDRNLAIAYGGMGRSKLLLGRAEETENHVLEALRLSPRDSLAFAWMNVAGYAKLLLGRDEEAIVWLRRSIDRNRNLNNSHYWLAVALTRLGRTEEAKAAAQIARQLNPDFVKRLRSDVWSDDPVYLAQFERVMDGLRAAGLPEG